MSGTDDRPGLTARQARRVEVCIIGLCIAALAMIFQPFSLTLFGVGAALVVLDRSQAPRLGERVHVRCSASKLHLFDASGRRVPQ